MNNLTHEQLIEYLKGKGVLKSRRLAQALLRFRREDFVGLAYQDEANNDYPLSIGYGQTISQPTTVVFMLEQLRVNPGDKVLDVGAGSGWQSALLSYLVGDDGKVIGLEIIGDLVSKARENIKKYHLQNVEIIHADGNEGFSLEAPYDKIIIAAAAGDVPKKLLDQLRLGGRMILPVGYGVQDVVLIEKVGKDRFNKKKFPGFVFVPFVKGKR